MSERPTNCDNCGACCLGQNLLPLMGPVLYGVKLPSDLKEGLEAVCEGPLSGGDEFPCIWLDRMTGRCIHHKLRPPVCCEFEVGGDDCIRIRAEAGL